ncbi:CIA30 family protein [Gimesia aquarii]|uniref:Complex I intermediate-associated protein 30 (CIA30) n=1 Tax=Gimesia aquarii TaxID=2527964 RepID=A0A517WYG0_9PLAN|nr:CIA30 family protein [Gimesia aquarii]QDU10287.1 Complex I intermediate-associated protein 30 (CIA30) [Gimesia aquarii]
MVRFFKDTVLVASVISVILTTNTRAIGGDLIDTGANASSFKLLAKVNYGLKPRILFDFSNQKAGNQWQTVNDGVMGGISKGRFRISNEGRLEFFGTLSLENNGGFASVRSRPKQLNLQVGDTLLTRVKGDGRKYSLNLYLPIRRVAFSYRMEFKTEKDKWIELRLPLKDFVATSFGRIVANAGQVNAPQVNSIGFLLGDKKAGPFKLDVDWIKVEAAQTEKL